MNIPTLIADASELVSLPHVYTRVNELIDDPDSTVEQFAEAVGQDAALTAKLLRIVNSPIYGFEIDNVARAVTVLGIREIRDLTLGVSSVKVFDGIPNELVTMESFWTHSIYCGLAARCIAQECGHRSEAMFVAGLLHDMGQLVMYNRIPDLTRQAMLAWLDDPDDIELYQAELKTIGFDHAQVGVALAKKWNLPPVLQECIEFHHEPDRAQNYPVEAAIVNLANTVAVMEDFGNESSGDIPTITPYVWERTGLDEAVLPAIVGQVKEQMDETRSMFFGAKSKAA